MTTYGDDFEDLAGLAYRVAFRILGNRAQAEEVAQEAMIRADLRWRRVADHARPWVSRVAANEAISIVRRRRAVPLARRAITDEHLSTLDRIDLQALLVQLPRRQREVVALRFLADLSEADVASELGCSVGSVKRHARRGLHALRGSVDPRPQEAF